MLQIIIAVPYFARSHAFHGVAGHGQEAVATGSIIRHCIYGREHLDYRSVLPEVGLARDLRSR